MTEKLFEDVITENFPKPRKEKTAIWKMKTEMDKITDIQNVNKKVPILTSMLLDGRKKKCFL